MGRKLGAQRGSLARIRESSGIYTRRDAYGQEQAIQNESEGALRLADRLHPPLVQDGIEIGVVVHLELPVEAEAAASAENLRPEFAEALCQVGSLLGEDDQSIFVAVVVLVGCRGPMNLFGGVVDLERKDGEPIDDEAWGFGVERSIGVLGAGELEQELVDLLDEIVALLVEAIDSVLDLGDPGVGDVGAAGGVFFMPEIEVGEMLGTDESDEVGRRGFGGMVSVPLDVRFVVEAEDGRSVELGGIRRSGLRLKYGHGPRVAKIGSRGRLHGAYAWVARDLLRGWDRRWRMTVWRKLVRGA